MLLQELLTRFTADTSQVDAEIRRLQQRTAAGGNGLATQLAGVGVSMTAALTLPAIALGKVSTDALMRFEVLKNGMVAVMGSARDASDEIARLIRLARAPGLGVEEAITASRNLQASTKVSAAEAEKIIKELANANTGGKEQFAGALVQITQMITKNRILQQDFSIIQENIPRINKAMLEAFGDTNIENIRKTGVSAKDMIMMMVEAMSRWDRTAGGLQNTVDNLKDSAETLKRNFGTAIKSMVDSTLSKLSGLINYFNNLGASAKHAISNMIITFAVIGPMLLVANVIPLITARLRVLMAQVWLNRSAFARLNVQLALLAYQGASIKVVFATLFPGVIRQLTYTRSLFISLANITKGMAKSIIALMRTNPWTIWLVAITAVVGLIIKFRNQLGLTDANLKKWGASIKQFLKPVVDAFKWLWSVIVAGWNQVKGVFVELWNSIKELYKSLKPALDEIAAAFKWLGTTIVKIALFALLASLAAVATTLAVALLALMGVLYGIVWVLKQIADAAKAVVDWFMKLIGLQGAMAETQRKGATMIELMAAVAIAALRDQDIAIARNFAKWENYYRQLGALATGRIEAIKAEMAADKEKQLAAVGFNSLRSLWQKGMESGAKEAFSIRGTSMDRGREIKLLENIAASSKISADAAKANKDKASDAARLADTKFNKALATFGQ